MALTTVRHRVSIEVSSVDFTRDRALLTLTITRVLPGRKSAKRPHQVKLDVPARDAHKLVSLVRLELLRLELRVLRIVELGRNVELVVARVRRSR